MQLLTLDNLKLDLGVTDAESDALLNRLSDKAAAEVEEIVGYPIERAVRTYSFRVERASSSITIPFIPLHSVTKVTVDGVVWLDTDNAVEAGAGFGFTPWGLIRAPHGCVFCGDVEIVFESGYRLESTGVTGEGRDLPLGFESAVAEMIRPRFHSFDRDPSIRSESVPGVHAMTFGGDTASSVAVPMAAWALLAPYRIVRVP